MAKIEILGVEHDYQLTPCEQESDITLVFIHGWMLSQKFWQPVIQTLKSDFNCLSYDLRGFGDSNRKAAPEPQSSSADAHSAPDADWIAAQRHSSVFSPAAFAWDLHLLLNELEVERAWLVGHSLGGTIAVWAAAMGQAHVPHRAMIDGVICLNSGGGIYVQEDFEKFRNAGRQILKFRPPWLAKVPGLDRIFSRSNVATAVHRQWGQQLLVDFLRVNREAGERSLLDSTTPEEVLLLPRLMRHLQMPAYFLAGDRDQVMAPKFVQHLASFHPLFNSKQRNVFELKNCGHLGMIEQPRAVSQLISKLVVLHTAP